MFNIKPIEQNISKYSKDELHRKIEVVGMKSKDLTDQIESIFKEISDLEARNSVLQYNLHSTTRDRVEDLDKITFDGSFYRECKSMEKEVQGYVGTYNHLLLENEIIQNNYRLIEGNNVRGKEGVKWVQNAIEQEKQKVEGELEGLRKEYESAESKKEGLQQQIQKNEKELISLLQFYSTIQSDIADLQHEKKDKDKQNNDTLMQINQLKQDSEMRHTRDTTRFQKCQESIKDIQRDLIKVENELRYVRGENERLNIIKTEVEWRNA